jgi:hypothetical protein
MKLRSALCLMGLGLGAACAVVVGCSSDDAGGTTVAGVGKQPPSPAGATATGTDERTFAVYSLQLGETDRAGVPSKDAWKKFGYDLDGQRSTKDSTSVCTQVPGASKSAQEDGDEGIDNAFGKTILPLLPISGPSKTINDSIQAEGTFTILMKLKGLSDEAAQTNTGLSGTLLVGGPLGTATAPKRPDFSPSFQWPYRAEPQIPISGAYINGGTFVNGTSSAPIELSLVLSGQALKLKINKPIITFKHSPPSDLAEGTIAGVIGTEELISSLEKVAGSLSTTLCGGAALDAIKDTIRKASDMLKDGTNRAGAACDAISVGIGFTAKRVANPTEIYKDDGVVPPDPCKPDAGAR